MMASSEVDCVRAACAAGPAACAASFRAASGQCVSAAVASSLLLSPQSAIYASSDGWCTLVSQNLIPEAPSALWILDSLHKGRNLGSKDRLPDIEGNLTSWNVTGPRWASKKTFAKFDQFSKALVDLQHDSKQIINFDGPFTIAVWLKCEKIDETVPIVEGNPRPNLDLWLQTDGNQDAINFQIGLKMSSQSNFMSVDRFSWRHIAVVLHGFGDTSFFANGISLGVKFSKAGNYSLFRPSYFRVGKFAKNHFLEGSMACLSIYEIALSREHVVVLMNACP